MQFLNFLFSLRFQEKGNLEVLLFTIQSRMRANNQRVYTPKEGALVADINRVRSLDAIWRQTRIRMQEINCNRKIIFVVWGCLGGQSLLI